MPFGGKPILGIVGGIASGKSFVSQTLESLGCCVIDSDAIAHDTYRRPNVIQTLRNWYGQSVIDANGAVNRRAIGSRVFSDPIERKRIEALLHPLINDERDARMQQAAKDTKIRAFVWDSPLLIEAGLHTQCDGVLFVDTPAEVRLRRVRDSRGWDAVELERRERSQMSLEEKRRHATDIVAGDLNQITLRSQLESILTRLSATVSSTK